MWPIEDTDVEATANAGRFRATDSVGKLPDRDVSAIVGMVSVTGDAATLLGQFFDPPHWHLTDVTVCFIVGDSNGKIIAQERLFLSLSPCVDRLGHASLNCFICPSMKANEGQTMGWYVAEARGTPFTTGRTNH
jgi:hypothetical protein